jgi:hypothetical protein
LKSDNPNLCFIKSLAFVQFQTIFEAGFVGVLIVRWRIMRKKEEEIGRTLWANEKFFVFSLYFS